MYLPPRKSICFSALLNCIQNPVKHLMFDQVLDCLFLLILVKSITHGFRRHYPLNSFSTNVPLLYRLKTSENLRFSDVFRGYRSGLLVKNGLSKFNELINYQPRNYQKTVGVIGGVEVNSFTQIRLILVAKFGDDP